MTLKFEEQLKKRRPSPVIFKPRYNYNDSREMNCKEEVKLRYADVYIVGVSL